MPTFGRKLRIFVEWSWAALFRTDITHLRFHRTLDLQDAAGPAHVGDRTGSRVRV